MSRPEAAVENLVGDDKFHVLLVGGDETSHSFNTTLFTRYSCKVSSVGNGIGAMAFLGILHPKKVLQPIPDMIITDFDLKPGLNGYSLLSLIRGLNTTRDLQVVVLLADEMLDKSHVFLSRGALVFRKPLTQENVATIMNQQNRGPDGLVRGRGSSRVQNPSQRKEKDSPREGLVRGSLRVQKQPSQRKGKSSRRKRRRRQRTESIMQLDSSDIVAEQTHAFQRLSLVS